MPTNERLRAAVLRAGITVDALAREVGVDPKTCARWITSGRIPHTANAAKAAAALHADVSYLWPGNGQRQPSVHPDVVAVYPRRADAPLEAWRALFEQAQLEIGILVYAGLFLHELWPDFNTLLSGRAALGCRVRILIGDPRSDAVRSRGREEKYGDGIEARCRQALMHYAPLIGVTGIEVRQHGTTLYNSVYIGDTTMLVNTHRYGINAYATPVIHLRRSAESGLFDGHAESFEFVWKESRPTSRE
jgi:hypothetical protein